MRLAIGDPKGLGRGVDVVGIGVVGLVDKGLARVVKGED